MVLYIEIISLSLYYASNMGALFYVGPAYETAMSDIRRLYPNLNVSHNLITDTRFVQCTDWMDTSDDFIAQYYYRNEDRWQRANLTLFLNTVADCDGHGSATLATNLRKFVISSSPAGDIENKVKWPTRIETGSAGKAALVSATKLFAALLLHFNWTTVSIVCDAYRNPLYDTVAQIMQATLSRLLRSNVSLTRVDGFSPQTDYNFILNEVNKQTRVVLYIVFGSTLRKFLIAARSLNMTQGEHVHLCFRVTRNPLLGNFHWRYGDKYDEVAKEAYRTVLIAESDPDLDVPPAGSEARRLREQWRQASLERYNFSYAASEPVVAEMVGANLTELLQDGRHIARRFYNRTFRLRTGNVSFDQYGSSAGVDGIVEQYDEAGNLTKVVHCAVGTVVPLAPVRIIEIKAVTWVGGVWPPPNRPPCGFDGMDPDCQPKRTLAVETLHPPALPTALRFLLIR
ncbi:hypothetical protein RvY_18324-2 [Ramazzottius varieornatus]|uniref:Receptor ligand binding region domain-containing protein n=1 Tax=Ramazzottius varieornatus TaxID=947166 RepID=A0A1D1W6Z8_RAMVA|nr:hypothetical protein RvY_18324-2 [Ramazzottius varieornatus]